MPVWIPLAIMAGVQTAANLIGQKHAQKVAMKNTNLTIAENKKLAQQSYDIEKQNISEMNKYNSPASQMQRFIDAGLNKKLVYQQGNPGNQTQIAKYNPPTVQYNYEPGFKGESLTPLTNLPQAAIQVKNLYYQGQINKAKAVMEGALSKYADELANNQNAFLYDKQQTQMFKRVFGEEEFYRFFELRNGYFYLRPESADTFVSNLTYRWLKPEQEYLSAGLDIKKKHLDIEIKESIANQIKFLPWLAPFLQFLNIVKP